ncbi:MAG TPA: hypothetical protein VGO68_02850 [Pyrinomonadaceae bacterium]|jgi:hypothetical protein|nr:hypothetical protein [Pyrinomonadaceae bacterium]
MKRFKSILCASLITLALSSAALAGDITGRAKPGDITGKPGDITGRAKPGDITGKAGDITGRAGDITGEAYNAILGLVATILG